MPDQSTIRLSEISQRLEQAAQRLRSGDIDGDEATRLAGECAALAQQAAVELDRLARWTPGEPFPGQEELL
jgi:hypothetical protein